MRHRIPQPNRDRRRPRAALALAAAVLTVSCATQWAPRARQSLPDGGLFAGGGDDPPAVCADLGGDDLQGLIRTAFAESPGLAQSWARLRQARAASRAQAGTLLPSLSLSAERTETETDAGAASATAGASPGTTGASGGSSAWQAGAAASYELDFWGRLHSRRAAARLSAEAAEADLRTAALTLAADTATAWAEWVTAVRRVATLADQKADAERLARLQALRFGQGQSDALALTQARQELSAVSARLAEARGNADNARVRLAMLLGAAPTAVDVSAPVRLPAPAGDPAPGVPSELLSARPDLRAAWLRLRAADAEAAAAAAERWPRLTLSANLFYQAAEFEDLFDESVRQIAAALDWTVFSGGRLAAEQDRAEARALERLYALEEAWLRALGEVQRALDGEAAARARQTELAAQLDRARERLALAHRRYAQGQSAYLEVLSAQQAVNSAELELLAARNGVFVQRVNLCRGLAAGVSGPLPEPVLMRAPEEGEEAS
ncbi:RND efflux system, outer membrane lipoprotein, NodT family [Salinisphaera sp. PC39]|uniref:TolC family protein n=1 Tax=Salinisphaera sp. PC39 TaxID=1304156 RepID=UPI0033408B9E